MYHPTMEDETPVESDDTIGPLKVPGTRPSAIDVLDQSHYRPTTDQRTLTRRAHERARKEQIRDRMQRDFENEELIRAAAASGASFAAIAHQLGMSRNTVAKIYSRAMDRPGDRDVVQFKAMQMDRLNRLLFSTWAEATANDGESVRNAWRLIQEMNRLEGAYPRVGIDVTGEIETRDVNVGRVATILERIREQEERRTTLAIEATAVDNVDPKPFSHRARAALNGHNGTSALDTDDPFVS